MRQKIWIQISLSSENKEKQFLKRRKRIVGIVAVVQSVYNGNNRDLKDRVRADEGQTG